MGTFNMPKAKEGRAVNLGLTAMKDWYVKIERKFNNNPTLSCVT